MSFHETFQQIAIVLENIGSSVEEKNYDGIIVKRLEASNTLDKGRTTKQSHIAITGPQMDMFPYVRADGYFEVDYDNEDSELKKYFVAQIPIYLHKENVEYLDPETQLFTNSEELVHVSIVRSRRKDAADQIQMSMTYMDSPTYVSYRRIVHAGSYMILLKRKSELLYDMYSVKPEDIDVGEVSLATKNNCFEKIATNTVVRLDELLQMHTRNDSQHDGLDEYQQAASIIKSHISESGLVHEESVDDISQVYDVFREKYGPEVLSTLRDDDVLKRIFYTAESTNDSLCYFLEFESRSRKFCGSIAGGSSYKFGLFQKKDGGIWITGSPNKPEELTNEQALELGKEIRDALVKGAKIIEEATLDSLEEYEQLDDKLNSSIGKYALLGWVHKYFHMLYPDKLSAFHSTDWQKHILYALKIKPSERYFARSGQIAMIGRYANLCYRHMFEACYDKFGGIKKFCKLGTNDREISYIAEWKKQNVIGLGWSELGSLEDYIIGNEINRKALCEKLQEMYYPDSTTTASRKAGEIVTFYRSNADTVFVMMDGHDILALVDNVGKYYYDIDSGMAHKKTGIWHCCFDEGDNLPNKAAGHMTSCYELNDEENLMYLYKKYYYELDETTEGEVVEEVIDYIEPVYNTDLNTKFECNRIVFGAPGTGKSYKLKCDTNDLIGEFGGTYERVTFHPDYTYSQFVGTYKPVTDANGDIRYAFVPGPFMRVYVEAIKSGRSNNPQPHLLLIEEINRAKVAAVFGDVFQLLDRDDAGVSEYEIQASEDIRKYLAKELGGAPDNYKKIRIPNNMFIWATMNSADQGVFPMDTAFKRRWNFEYLGIDENEEKISGIGKIMLSGTDEPIEWNHLRKAINAKMSSSDFKINEDKLMGPFFLSKKVIASNENGMIFDKEKFIDAFKSKVIMYLYEDAVKQGKHRFFEGCPDTSKYSAVCDAFDKIGTGIFGVTFRETFYDKED